MKYWKIENPGVADFNALTLFGGTTKRESEDSRIIGTFGSGSKQAVCLLIRNGIFPVIFAGKLKMEYKTKGIRINQVNHQQLFVQLKGKENDQTVNREEDLKCTLAFGSQDWNDINMALREYVSNSIDALYESSNDYHDLKIEMVDENQVRAKEGTTRVFIPATEEINKYFVNIGDYFLHLGEEKYLNSEVINKDERKEKTVSAKLYRRGVLVRSVKAIENTPALFDYNLNNLKLDDSRNFSEYGALSEIARCLSRSKEDVLVVYFKSFLSGINYLEHNLDSYYLSSCYGFESNHREENWQNAWKKVFGSLGIACVTDNNAAMVNAKGYKAVKMPQRVVDVCKKFGIKTDVDVLNDFEKNDLYLEDPTDDIVKIGDCIWQYLENKGRTEKKCKPKYKCFVKGMDCSSIVWGFYRDNIVAINKDIANGINVNLISTVLEEIIHHITGSFDCTRDFQTAAFDVAAGLLEDRFFKEGA